MVFLAVLPLAGCFGSDIGTLGFLSAGKEEAGQAVLRKVALYDGDVVVRGPGGYCIDRRTLRPDGRAGFVLVASCESLSGLRGQAVEPVLITVSVLPDMEAGSVLTAEEMANDLAPAEVLAAHESDGLTLVQLSSGGDRILPEGDARHWRGSMAMNGHMIGLALYARKGSPMAGADGRGMLIELAQRIRRASPERPKVPPTSEDAPPAEAAESAL